MVFSAIMPDGEFEFIGHANEEGYLATRVNLSWVGVLNHAMFWCLFGVYFYCAQERINVYEEK